MEETGSSKTPPSAGHRYSPEFLVGWCLVILVILLVLVGADFLISGLVSDAAADTIYGIEEGVILSTYGIERAPSRDEIDNLPSCFQLPDGRARQVNLKTAYNCDSRDVVIGVKEIPSTGSDGPMCNPNFGRAVTWRWFPFTPYNYDSIFYAVGAGKGRAIQSAFDEEAKLPTTEIAKRFSVSGQVTGFEPGHLAVRALDCGSYSIVELHADL